MITEAILKQAHDDLEKRKAALKNVQFEKPVRMDFSFKEITDGFERGAIGKRLTKECNIGTGSSAIYRITVDSIEGAAMLQEAFAAQRGQDKHKLARNNDIKESCVVYVGSSKKIGQRLQQHLYECAKATYALRMHLWCPNADHTITVEIAVFPENVEGSFMQDIEDALWKTSRPMFGKLGPK